MTALTAKLGLDASALKREAKAAAKAVDEVTDATEAAGKELDKVGGKKITPKVDARAATAEVEGLRSDLARLDQVDARARLDVEMGDASRRLSEVSRELLSVDGREARARVMVEHRKASADLRRIIGEVNRLDGETADVKINVDTAEAEAGVGNLGSMLSGLAGKAKGAGPAALVTGLVAAAGAIQQVASAQADLALSAQTYADLVGAGVEEASKLLAVTSRVGIEANDLSDITLQMTQAFTDAPELARELGINLGDGANGAQRLVQVLEKMNDPTRSAVDKARIFGRLLGEEGVRQGQALASQIGDISAALEGVPDAQVISPEDVAEAREYKEAMQEISSLLKSAVALVGKFAIPEITDTINDLHAIADGIGSVVDAAGDFLGIDLSGIDFSESLKDFTGFSAIGDLADLSRDATELSGSLQLVNPDITEFGSGARRAAKETADLVGPVNSARNALDGFGAGARRAEDDINAARQSFEGFVDAQRAAIDPAFAVINAQKQLTDALADLNEAGGNTTQNLVAVTEAGGNLRASQAALAQSSGNATQAVYDLGIASGLTTTQAMTLAGEVSDARVAAEDLEGNYDVTVAGIDHANPLINDTRYNLTTLRDKTITLTTKRVTVFLNNGTPSKRGTKATLNDSGGRIPAGAPAIIAEKRPEYVNGVLHTTPTMIYGPADVTSGARTQQLLAQQQTATLGGYGRSSMVSSMRSATGGASSAPLIQVLLDSEQIAAGTARSVLLATERERLLA